MLIGPDGNIVAFDLRGEQLIDAVRKLKNVDAKQANGSKGQNMIKAAVINEAQTIPDKPLYEQYVALERQRDKQIADGIAQLRATKGEAYLNTAEGKQMLPAFAVLPKFRGLPNACSSCSTTILLN